MFLNFGSRGYCVVQVQCAHGDEVEYATAEVKVWIGERKPLVKVVMSSTFRLTSSSSVGL